MKKCPLCNNNVPCHDLDPGILKKTFWFTGLPCSGKTTVADKIKETLSEMGYPVIRLDGDVIRHGLCYGLGFSPEGRMENIRRVAHVSQMMNDHNTIVLASFVSPTIEIRQMIDGIIRNVDFVYVKCSAEECANRDVKGMWKKALNGEIPNFTGVDAPFDNPESATLILDTEKETLEESTNKFINKFFKL